MSSERWLRASLASTTSMSATAHKASCYMHLSRHGLEHIFISLYRYFREFCARTNCDIARFSSHA